MMLHLHFHSARGDKFGVKKLLGLLKRHNPDMVTVCMCLCVYVCYSDASEPTIATTPLSI
jgi:hypothetical protein